MPANNTIQTKLIITGVGGQGIVYLVEVLTGAAVLDDIPVATSEIHGLSQRGGAVTASVTFGENTFGYVEEGGADFLLGLELLESVRCVKFLHSGSIAVIDNTMIFPHSVNAGGSAYPDIDTFLNFLKKNIRKVTLITEKAENVTPIMRNLLVLGRAASLPGFPVTPELIEKSILENSRGNPKEALRVFRIGTGSVKRIKPAKSV